MLITNLKIENFRNYNKLNLNLNNKINIFYGNNAQGKTNIIESIFLCSIGKSFRTSKDKEGYGDFYVVQRGDSLSTIGKRFNKTEKQLLEDNNITSNKEVIPGHVIKID